MLWLNVNLSSRKKKPLVGKETKTKKRFVGDPGSQHAKYKKEDEQE